MMKMKYCKYTIILATTVNQSCECFYLISPLTIIAKLLMDKAGTRGSGRGVELIPDPTSETTRVDPLNPGWY